MPKPVVHSMMEMLVALCPHHDKKTRQKLNFTETSEHSTDRTKPSEYHLNFLRRKNHSMKSFKRRGLCDSLIVRQVFSWYFLYTLHLC